MSRLLVIVTLLAVVTARPAVAWNKAGHMVTGAIAYDVLLAEQPQVVEKTLELLRANPTYERLWKRQLQQQAEADRDRLLFMLAARWADDIRGDRDYDRPTWHYIGTGFIAPGQPPTLQLPKVPEPNAVTAILFNARMARAAPEFTDRALAVTWLFHLVGDIQQPLHACSRVSEQLPEGDRGGNLFFIRVTPESEPINLHKFWDDLIIGRDDYRSIRNRAIELRLRPEFARDKLTELADFSPEAWAQESLLLGRTIVHRNGELRGGRSEFTAELLPADYPKQAQALAERRAVLGGYRLAQMLATLDPPPPNNTSKR
jgi:hypothetical protein